MNAFCIRRCELFADQKIGDAIFRVMYDSAAIGEVLYSGVLSPTMSITMIALAMTLLCGQFSNEPLIPILAGLAMSAVAITSALFGRRLRDQSQRMREHGSAVMAAFEERIDQVQLIKAFGQEAREIAAVDAESRGSYHATLTMLLLIMTMLLAGDTGPRTAGRSRCLPPDVRGHRQPHHAGRRRTAGRLRHDTRQADDCVGFGMDMVAGTNCGMRGFIACSTTCRTPRYRAGVVNWRNVFARSSFAMLVSATSRMRRSSNKFSSGSLLASWLASRVQAARARARWSTASHVSSSRRPERF